MFDKVLDMPLKIMPKMEYHVSSSRPQPFCKKGVLQNFAKFAGKHMKQSLVFNKPAG